MRTFKCSYAHDVPKYFDFIVHARTEEEAQAKMERALKAGVFENVTTQEFDNGVENERVFVSAVSSDHDGEITLSQLIKQAKATK